MNDYTEFSKFSPFDPCVFSNLGWPHKADKRFLHKFVVRQLIKYSRFTVSYPFVLIDSIKYNGKPGLYNLEKPPIFVVGHWRSGTTYLHYLLTKDNNFGYPRRLHVAFPYSFESMRWIEHLLKLFPQSRPMDKMEVEIDSPSEEEFALAKMVPYSYYHGFIFPDQAQNMFRKYVMLEGIRGDELQALAKVYSLFVRKLSGFYGGKQLLFKNPVNTGRVNFLKGLFPDAKFIHIYRNPYNVYQSTKNMRLLVQKKFQLSDLSTESVENMILDQYRMMMEAYLQARKQINEDQIVEVCYEDLVAHPKKEIRRVYETIGLSYSETVESNIESYLKKTEGYKVNNYNFSASEKTKIDSQWEFAFDEWGYSRKLSEM